MPTSVVYPPQWPVQARAVYQSNGGTPNEDRALPPLNRTTLCPSAVSEMSQRSADAFLAPRRHNPMKQSLQKPYKCPMCPYSSYIGALCEQHVANVHSPQTYLPMPFEPPIMYPIPMGQLSPQQPQPHGLPMMMRSPNMQPSAAIPVAAYFAPVVQVATPPSEPQPGSPGAASPVVGSPPTHGCGEHNNEYSTDSKSDSENDVAKLQVCTFSGCGYASNSKKFFNRHIQYAHRKKRQLSCTRCKFSTRDPIIYKAHLLEHLGL